MPVLLFIDTALEKAIVAIGTGEKILAVAYNEVQQQHAAWLHTAIEKMMLETSTDWKEIDAVVVTEGPGSYTGLRIGLSAAKGFCYALGIPLIVVNTLHLIALANKSENTTLYIPMVDARRNEVFTATYDKNFNMIKSTHALLLDNKSFTELEADKIIFCGSGAAKFEILYPGNNSVFILRNYTEIELYTIGLHKFTNGIFSDLTYTIPDYGKNFMFNLPKIQP